VYVTRVDFSDLVFSLSSVLSLALTFLIHNKQVFHFSHATCSPKIKSRVVLTLVKTAVLRIMLNMDGHNKHCFCVHFLVEPSRFFFRLL
jgi:hypothetical protein